GRVGVTICPRPTLTAEQLKDLGRRLADWLAIDAQRDGFAATTDPEALADLQAGKRPGPLGLRLLYHASQLPAGAGDRNSPTSDAAERCDYIPFADPPLARERVVSIDVSDAIGPLDKLEASLSGRLNADAVEWVEYRYWTPAGVGLVTAI